MIDTLDRAALGTPFRPTSVSGEVDEFRCHVRNGHSEAGCYTLGLQCPSTLAAFSSARPRDFSRFPARSFFRSAPVPLQFRAHVAGRRARAARKSALARADRQSATIEPAAGVPLLGARAFLRRGLSRLRGFARAAALGSPGFAGGAARALARRCASRNARARPTCRASGDRRPASPLARLRAVFRFAGDLLRR